MDTHDKQEVTEGLTTCKGLPFDRYLKPGRYCTNITIGGVTYNPGYIWVVADPDKLGDTIISKVGLQPHLMMPV